MHFVCRNRNESLFLPEFAIVFLLLIAIYYCCYYEYESNPATKRIKLLKETVTKTGRLLVVAKFHPHMGVGNKMFVYASLYGIGKSSGRLAAICGNNAENDVTAAFPYWTIPIVSSEICDREAVILRQRHSRTFDWLLVQPAANESVVQVGVYLQSWRYFGPIFEAVRKEFVFSDTIRGKCEKKINRAISPFDRRSCTLIGVHVRRGDFLNEPQRIYGHLPATEHYLNTSVDYFRRKLGKTISCLLFLVVGNDFRCDLCG